MELQLDLIKKFSLIKCQKSHSGFELWSLCLFLIIITITPSLLLLRSIIPILLYMLKGRDGTLRPTDPATVLRRVLEFQGCNRYDEALKNLKKISYDTKFRKCFYFKKMFLLFFL